MKATIRVRFEFGEPFAQIQVRGTRVIRTLLGERKLNPTETVTDNDGRCQLDIPAPAGPSAFEFEATGTDASGVQWHGVRRVSWNLVFVRRGLEPPRRECEIDIRRGEREHGLFLSAELRSRIRRARSGDLLLTDADELTDCLSKNLPAASLAMVGKVLDGAIKVRALSDGWWSGDWDRTPLGPLLETDEIKQRITDCLGTGGWERLKGSGVYVRNVGAHHKFERVSMEEALASTRVVFDFLSRWL